MLRFRRPLLGGCDVDDWLGDAVFVVVADVLVVAPDVAVEWFSFSVVDACLKRGGKLAGEFVVELPV